ncbi:hypothetical protein E2C01_101854 [Portunus trituberculatus]|uniref:Uncharacterized protein n=1 Tax=Portunus trituberculatus TaxID=210409 RepID=A0A5B7K6N9_PORTR|nr:hypothetical protein [Portunus trituberculatus]
MIVAWRGAGIRRGEFGGVEACSAPFPPDIDCHYHRQQTSCFLHELDFRWQRSEEAVTSPLSTDVLEMIVKDARRST